MAYQMVCGQLPFEADSAIDVIHKHVAEAPPPLEQILPGLPKHVINAINRAMSKRADERFPTVQGFVSAMRNAPAEATLVMERRLVSRATSRRSGLESSGRWKGSAGRVAVGTGVVGALVVGTLLLNNRVRDGQRQPEQQLAAAPPSAPATVPPAAPTVAPPPAAPASRREAAAPPRSSAAHHDLAAAPTSAPAPTHAVPPAAPRDTGAPSAKNAGAPATSSATGHLGYVRISVGPVFADSITIGGKTVTQRRGITDTLEGGLYNLVVTRSGFRTYRHSVSVQPGKLVDVQVVLVPGQP